MCLLMSFQSNFLWSTIRTELALVRLFSSMRSEIPPTYFRLLNNWHLRLSEFSLSRAIIHLCANQNIYMQSTLISVVVLWINPMQQNEYRVPLINECMTHSLGEDRLRNNKQIETFHDWWDMSSMWPNTDRTDTWKASLQCVNAHAARDVFWKIKQKIHNWDYLCINKANYH